MTADTKSPATDDAPGVEDDTDVRVETADTTPASTEPEVDTERTLPYVMAFNEAVKQAMEDDPDVFVAGEDVGAFGGVFGTFGGLQKKFGTDRVV
ncbi:MAG: hypothetical protein ACR2HP_18710, partial [Ilumatobacteraceae bacterium]